MEIKQKVRGIKGVPEETWRRFTAETKLQGLTQAELFKDMLNLWLAKQEKMKKEEH